MKDFWVTNISKRNVCLSDLALTIKKQSSVNLLDHDHYHYSLEQLEKSAASGSIFLKSHFIRVRKVPPQFVEPAILIVQGERTGLNKSVVKIEIKEYEALDDSDEKFAEQSADIEIARYNG